MLTDIFYILPASLLNSYDFKSDYSTIAVEVNISDLNGLQNAYKRLSEVIIFQQFCLSIIIPENINEDILNAATSCFFFPGYQKIGGAPVLLVKAEKEEVVNQAGQILDGSALAQGFAGVVVKWINSGKKTAETLLFPDDPETVKAAYTASLYHTDQESTGIYIQLAHPAEAAVITEMLQREEEAFKAANYSLFILKEKVRQLVAQTGQFRDKYAAAEREIATMARHIAILQSESQAAYLQNFYNNEYEILPAWYKRFGHILKVLTGKRNFKSLFSNNIKKYKG